MDIKETTELLDAAHEPIVAGLKAVEDGKLTIEDAQYFEQCDDKIKAAVESIDKIPAEIKDLNWLEGIALARKAAAIASDAVKLGVAIKNIIKPKAA